MVLPEETMADSHATATYQVEPDFAARQAILWAVAWLVGAATFALIVNALLIVPDIGGGLPFLAYGRLRAVAETTLWFGWLATAGFAITYGVLPRITNSQLHNEALGAAATMSWSLLLTIGIGALLLGVNQGRPMAELPAGVDIGLGLMLVFVLYNAGVTVVRRRERTLYVSGWYILAAALVAPIVFVIGNLPVFSGVTDLIVSGFYTNGIEMLWLLPVGLAAAHYVVPVETGNALHSSALARAGFWSLIAAGGWTGQRLYLKGPAPDYLESIAVAMTFVLLVPVVSSIVNLIATGRGRWHLMTNAFGSRFAVAGLGLLAAWIVLVVAAAVPWVSRFLGASGFAGAVRYLGAFGVLTSFALAFIYHAYPLMVGRDWYSRPLVAFHFWATLVAVAFGTVVHIASSAAQAGVLAASGAAGLAGAAQASVEVGRLFQIGALCASGLFCAAQFAFVYNTYRTSKSGALVRVIASPATVGGRA